MPASEVMGKWESGKLHSGSKSGPLIPHTRAGALQAYAIKKSEERAASKGKKEYQGGFHSIGR